MKLSKSQAGLFPILLLYVAMLGIVFYILMAAILPLANKRFTLLYPKRVSKALSPPIVIKSSSGEHLSVNDFNIPLITSPNIKIEITFPSDSSIASPAASLFFRIAEKFTNLDSVSYEPYIKEPTIIDYTFKDGSLGSKFIWVEFKDSENKTDRKVAQIELVSDLDHQTPERLPDPLFTVKLEEDSSKTKDCSIFCQSVGLINGFNQIIEQRMEQWLLKIGLLKP